MPYICLKSNIKLLCIEPPGFGVIEKGKVYRGNLILTKAKISPKRYVLFDYSSYAFQQHRFRELPSILNINSKTI